MSGTVSGGKKAAQKNITRHGKNFYKEIGSKGGKNSKRGGFASEKIGKDGLTGLERAKLAGRKGGTISKRGPAIRLTTDKIKKIKEELNEAEQETVKMKIRLLNKELERLRSGTTHK